MAKSERTTVATPAVLLTVVVATHLALAFTSATPAVHTGGDNAAYLSLANSLVQDGTYSELWHPGAPPHARYPPLYPAGLALLILAGAKTWGVFKVASMLFTAVATAFCFLWVRRLHGTRSAAALAFLFGVAPSVLYATQWILSDPLFLALTLGCLWLWTPKQRPSGERAGRAGANRLPAVQEMAAGLALAVAAYFTRSAGLPLIAAAALWLVLQKRWAVMGVLAGGFAIPAGLWWLRSGGDYVSVFWMSNPYAPDLGRASLPELVQRVGENLWGYTANYVPAGLSGLDGLWGTALGVVLAALTLTGWLRRMRAGPGIAELFFLVYAGLILAWPAVWSGDRFALPLFPLVLLYSGETLTSLAARLSVEASRRPKRAERSSPWPPRLLAMAVAAVMLVPAGVSWYERAGMANLCRARVAVAGPMGCYGNNVAEFHAMSRWAGDQLPEGATVFSRKPRLFYAFSGRQSVTYPFTGDGRSLLVQADSLGIGYVLRGNWDNSGAAYVDPVITANPDRFCVVAQLRAGDAPPISLLAIVESGADDSEAPAEGPLVSRCPGPGWGAMPSAGALGSMKVPILDP